ncbi:MAG: RluA family pseudouridine synthase [Lachnospiraceae bacterium]|nr:RluA family pseudouridine synthase [Lachnospiraceae bacterium]
MNRMFHFHITKQNEEEAIDFFLKSHGFSRHIISQLKKYDDGILVNQQHQNTRYHLKNGDLLRVNIREESPSKKIVPVPMNLNIVFEDEDILVLNKPADTPIHPSLNNYENSLANGVAYYYQKEDSPFVFRCINRLDRDTTGLTIIAKNSLSSAILSSMVSKRLIHREYFAIVQGNPPDSGTVDAPIGRKSNSAIERMVDFEHGEKAVTHYKKLAYKNNHSLLKLKLETGRTHQIRVHMKHIGYPLIGDYLYNPDYTYIKRQALHSYRLTFTHPITRELLEFTAPLPGDMEGLVPFSFS